MQGDPVQSATLYGGNADNVQKTRNRLTQNMWLISLRFWQWVGFEFSDHHHSISLQMTKRSTIIINPRVKVMIMAACQCSCQALSKCGSWVINADDKTRKARRKKEGASMFTILEAKSENYHPYMLTCCVPKKLQMLGCHTINWNVIHRPVCDVFRVNCS